MKQFLYFATVPFIFIIVCLTHPIVGLCLKTKSNSMFIKYVIVTCTIIVRISGKYIEWLKT